jgi:hypothetical protein
VNVAAGGGIAYAEQLEAAVGVVHLPLRSSGEQGVEIDLAEVRGLRLELEVQLVRGQGAAITTWSTTRSSVARAYSSYKMAASRLPSRRIAPSRRFRVMTTPCSPKALRYAG